MSLMFFTCPSCNTKGIVSTIGNSIQVEPCKCVKESK